MAVKRPRRVQVRPFPSSRRLVTAALRAGRRMAPMSGLIDVDVTTANRLLASHDPPWSLTAFVVASVEAAAPPILVPSNTRTGRARAATAWVIGRRR